MRSLKTRKMRHRCSTPFCGGTNVTAITRAGSFAAAPPLYLCDTCMKELAEAYKAQKRKNKGTPKPEENSAEAIEEADTIEENEEA